MWAPHALSAVPPCTLPEIGINHSSLGVHVPLSHEPCEPVVLHAEIFVASGVAAVLTHIVAHCFPITLYALYKMFNIAAHVFPI
jgi:hypothetical protein